MVGCERLLEPTETDVPRRSVWGHVRAGRLWPDCVVDAAIAAFGDPDRGRSCVPNLRASGGVYEKLANARATSKRLARGVSSRLSRRRYA